MPVYEYTCRHCGTRFDEMKPMSERLDAPRCDACGRTTSLALSVPGRVGATAPSLPEDACGMGDGSCCGGVCLN